MAQAIIALSKTHRTPGFLYMGFNFPVSSFKMKSLRYPEAKILAQGWRGGKHVFWVSQACWKFPYTLWRVVTFPSPSLRFPALP